ncbi:hypothetical protein AcW2_005732 [Taiwanofungus camphoratus]|nr:hypothetical protein AcW2_005732 [Antrodia cinnamomea]
MKASHPVITGAKGGTVRPDRLAPNRLDIHELVKDTRQFSLYIQALEMLSKRKVDNLLSFFNIGGIHGLPFQRWGESGGDKPAAEWGGYCTHGSVIFPTWHRPYVALFEQELYDCAAEIAKEYQSSEWIMAAANLRAPYWDWASDISLPGEVTSETVIIITPGGQKEIKNPLAQYLFHSDDPTDTFGDFKDWPSTLRYPDRPYEDKDAKSSNTRLKTALEGHARQARTDTYNCLTRLQEWDAFSNHTTGGSAYANSLESIHDTMHVKIGGLTPWAGHMSDTGVAGFDPIFYMHHANVDRLLALWSALNPDIWVTRGKQYDGGSYTVKNEAYVDSNTDLTPFWTDQTAYWKSNSIQQSPTLNYTYPEFNDLNHANKWEVMAAIRIKIEELYGSLGRLGKRLPQIQTNPNTGHYDWTVHLKFKKFELGSSFSILVFLGPVPAERDNWYSSSSYVGTVSAFVGRSSGRCANCVANRDVEIEGFVHLNEKLVEIPDLVSLSPAHVRPVIQERLAWRVEGVKADGTVAEPTDLPSLKLAPFSQTITEGPYDQFPTLGEAVYYHDIVRHLPGGVPVEGWAA